MLLGQPLCSSADNRGSVGPRRKELFRQSTNLVGPPTTPGESKPTRRPLGGLPRVSSDSGPSEQTAAVHLQGHDAMRCSVHLAAASGTQPRFIATIPRASARSADSSFPFRPSWTCWIHHVDPMVAPSQCAARGPPSMADGRPRAHKAHLTFAWPLIAPLPSPHAQVPLIHHHRNQRSSKPALRYDGQ